MSRPRAARRGEGASCGFTLIETLIAMTLFVLMLLAVMTTYTPNREIHVSGERKVDVQQNARLALADMAREIRNAGYFPENFDVPPADPALATPVRLATDGVLAVYGDTNGAGFSSVLLYCLDGDRLLKRRAAVDAADAYTCSGGQVIAEQANALQFHYYDEASDPVPSPSTPPFQLDGQSTGSIPDMSDTAQRSSVRRIVITLVMADELPKRGTYLYSLTTEIMLRNVS